MMKSTGLAIVLLGCMVPCVVAAEQVVGRVSFVGTIGEFNEAPGVFHAQFRMRISESTCSSTGNVRRDRWIHVRSGRMDAPFQHNSVNFRNGYNTAMSGLLARTVVNIQVDGVPDCDADKIQQVNLWSSNIGLFP
jgi:hypothetical protein